MVGRQSVGLYVLLRENMNFGYGVFRWPAGYVHVRTPCFDGVEEVR